jgi:hypothetical protein
MADQRDEDARTALTTLFLALGLLARRPRSWMQQRRAARLGLGAARKLAALVLVRNAEASPRDRDRGGRSGAPGWGAMLQFPRGRATRA